MNSGQKSLLFFSISIFLAGNIASFFLPGWIFWGMIVNVIALAAAYTGLTFIYETVKIFSTREWARLVIRGGLPLLTIAGPGLHLLLNKEKLLADEALKGNFLLFFLLQILFCTAMWLKAEWQWFKEKKEVPKPLI